MVLMLVVVMLGAWLSDLTMDRAVAVAKRIKLLIRGHCS